MNSNTLKDMTGLRFDRITVIARAETPPGKVGAHWLCECTCGAQKVIHGKDLRSGDTRSCGCLLRELRESGERLGGVKAKSDGALAKLEDPELERCPKCNLLLPHANCVKTEPTRGMGTWRGNW